MNNLNTVRITTSTGAEHEWTDVMWAVSSDDTLIIYGVEDMVGQKTYKVAQFAKGAWSLVEIVTDNVYG